MAAKSHEAGYTRFFGDRLTGVSYSTTDKEIKDVYDDWASKYDEQGQAAGVVFHKPLVECLDAAIKQVFPDQQQDQIKIIDAGAGTGLVGVELQKLGYTHLHALDISRGMLNEAKKTNAYKKFICAALSDQRIPEIETGEFHALISGGTLVTGHVRPSAFVEMLRMVNKGGLLCFSIRVNELDDYQGMMSELEKAERWSLFCKKTLPFFITEGMPKETFAFVYKVL